MGGRVVAASIFMVVKLLRVEVGPPIDARLEAAAIDGIHRAIAPVVRENDGFAAPVAVVAGGALAG
ncbi:MAG: hypothetical protein JW940_14825 [Polyangiaceae bacterium]|nr:hypothetical protein [Polyangiaceae bacterium]